MRKTFIFVSMFLAVSTTVLGETAVCHVNQITRTEAVSLTITCTAGNLATSLEGQAPTTITDLVVTGTINQVDLAIIKDMPALVNVDLSGTTVEACTILGTTYAAHEIPIGMFKDNKTFISFKLPGDITKIGDSAFSNCAALSTIVMPNTVSAIDDQAFNLCPALTDIALPSNLKTIGYRAFKDCTGLLSITIPNSVTFIDGAAFIGCSTLASISLPSSLTAISGGAFNGCSGLLSITIPNSVTTIGAGAFNGCSTLASISLPSSLTTISEGAFNGCSTLASISLPSSLTSIENFAFAYDNLLEKIICYSSTPPIIADNDAFKDVNTTSCKVYVPIGAVPAYKANLNWNKFTNIVEYNPTGIQSVTANTKLSFNENTITVSSDKVMTQVDILNFDGKLLARQHCNNSSCTIELKGESKVLAKIVYQDGTSQTHKLVAGK